MTDTSPTVERNDGADDEPMAPVGVGNIEASFDYILNGREEARAAAHKAETERDAAYRERAHLVALLSAQYPSHIGHTDPNAPDWAVVTVELPTGQACWHIAPADMDLFAHVQPTPHYARGWDGHSTEEKYARIAKLAAHPTAPKWATS